MVFFGLIFSAIAIWICYKKATELGRNPTVYILLALLIPFIAIIWPVLVKPTGIRVNSDFSKPKKKDENLLDD